MTEVYLIAMTGIQDGWYDFLHKLGHKDWITPKTYFSDLLVEFAGRLCYRSWAPYKEGEKELNPNVQKVRHGNKGYIQNMLESGHGSVLEHINFTFLLKGVSRVLTHELVRHRAGMAYSQESLRYVRLEHLELIIPEEIDPDALELMNETTKTVRCVIAKLNKILLEDAPDFATKKRLTSLIRRIAPIGTSTSILFTANARALRHIIQMRVNPLAEVEIREVFYVVAEVCRKKAPNIFQDMHITPGHCFFENSKV